MKQLLLTGVALVALVSTAYASGGGHPTGTNVGATAGAAAQHDLSAGKKQTADPRAAKIQAAKTQAATLQSTTLGFLASYYGLQADTFLSLSNYFASIGNSNLATTYSNIAVSYDNAEISVHNQEISALEAGN